MQHSTECARPVRKGILLTANTGLREPLEDSLPILLKVSHGVKDECTRLGGTTVGRPDHSADTTTTTGRARQRGPQPASTQGVRQSMAKEC
jgi:hypothetical protein